MKMYSLALAAVAISSIAALWPIHAHADEGMWLFNDPPRQKLKDKYGFDITDQWLEHVQVVGPLQQRRVRFIRLTRGLVMSNHHVGADCLRNSVTKITTICATASMPHTRPGDALP
jgi:hypothetical protein